MRVSISEEEADFLARIGGGSLSHGIELVIKLAKAAEEALDLRLKERQKESHEPPSLPRPV